MEMIDTIKRGFIEVVKPPESFDGATVSLLNGARLHPDVVICATGYRRGLESLVGHLGVLNEHWGATGHQRGTCRRWPTISGGLAAPIAIRLRRQALATHGQPNRQ